ncbi:MAG: hypothetical protein ACK46Q_12835 [Hyphomonas sp.]
MIVYTPSTGRVHVRAGNRKLRHTVAERFIETALEQTYSNQPVDFQAYDISQFLQGLDLEPPELDDVVIDRAQVIRADISIGNLANRLSLSTTIDQDISEIIDSQPGLPRIFACWICANRPTGTTASRSRPSGVIAAPATACPMVRSGACAGRRKTSTSAPPRRCTTCQRFRSSSKTEQWRISKNCATKLAGRTA